MRTLTLQPQRQAMPYALVLPVPLLIAVQALDLSVRRHHPAAIALNIFLDQHALLYQPLALQVPSTQLKQPTQPTLFVLLALLAPTTAQM